MPHSLQGRRIAVDSELENVLIPQLILQPVMENCVQHGYYADGRVLTVTVMAQTENGVLEISVVDDGRGMEEDRLKQIQASIARQENLESDDGKHIGLSNVHRRITLQYGVDYGMKIWSAPGKGATVKVRFPLVMPARKSDA
nr:ATP-binding protein [uncultured Acetatifactor sp.]